MGLELKVYIHGVPNGQKIWGMPDEDKAFLESFYGRENSLPIQMYVDVNKFNKRYSYYTYVVKTLAEEGRTGSYFAITVRLNAYYADVFNMHNILDALYSKYMFDGILKQEGTMVAYQIQDFLSVSEWLQRATRELENYIEKFSSPIDFIPLDNFNLVKGGTVSINLLDCKNREYAKKCVQEGKTLIISVDYPTKELKELKNRRDKDIREVQVLADKKLSDEREKSGLEIEKLRSDTKDVRNRIQTLQSQYENVKSKNDTLEQENQRLKDIEIKYNQKKKKYDQANEILSNLKKIIQDAEQIGIGNNIKRPGGNNPSPIDNGGRKPIPVEKFKYDIKKISIISLLLLFFVAFGIYKKCTSNRTQKEVNIEKVQKIQSENKKDEKSLVHQDSIVQDSIKNTNQNKKEK